MTTAGDLINGSLRLIGVLAEGETPSADTSQDALTAMNQMLQSWNTERLSVYSTLDQVINWLPNTISGTLGPSGTLGAKTASVTSASGDGTTVTMGYSSVFVFLVGESITVSGMTPSTYNGTYTITATGVGTISFASTVTTTATVLGTILHSSIQRPVQIDDSTYFRDPTTGISYGIKLINQQQYDGIAVKTVTSTYPQVMFVNMTYPNLDLYIYPVPTKLLEFHFISVQELDQPASLATDLLFPPGYLRCFRYNLACELAPEFGTEPSRQVSRIAMTSKRNIKRINNPGDIMALPYSIVGTRQRFNIYAGNY